jgi:hypothetical protein
LAAASEKGSNREARTDQNLRDSQVEMVGGRDNPNLGQQKDDPVGRPICAFYRHNLKLLRGEVTGSQIALSVSGVIGGGVDALERLNQHSN